MVKSAHPRYVAYSNLEFEDNEEKRGGRFNVDIGFFDRIERTSPILPLSALGMCKGRSLQRTKRAACPHPLPARKGSTMGRASRGVRPKEREKMMHKIGESCRQRRRLFVLLEGKRHDATPVPLFTIVPLGLFLHFLPPIAADPEVSLSTVRRETGKRHPEPRRQARLISLLCAKTGGSFVVGCDGRTRTRTTAVQTIGQ